MLAGVAGADHPAVRCVVHAAECLVAAAPARVHLAGCGTPGRGAGRGRDHRAAGADPGEGARLAAATGARISSEDESEQAQQPPRPHLGPPRAHAGGPGVT